jgi:hypothetical protein
LPKIDFYHQTYFYNFEALKFHDLNITKFEKNRFFCILKVTDNFGTDPHPHPDPLVEGTDPRIRIPRYQNVMDPEHWDPNNVRMMKGS